MTVNGGACRGDGVHSWLPDHPNVSMCATAAFAGAVVSCSALQMRMWVNFDTWPRAGVVHGKT